jgi:hypothetical protein
VANTFKLLLILLITGFGCREAGACSCSLLSAHDRYRQADAVFVGTAVSRTLFGSGIRFHIEENFWGTSGDYAVVKHHDPIICDSFAFKVGRKYLVVAYKERGELSATACNQGAGIEVAAGDIHVLRGQHEGKPIPQVYGVVTRRDGTPLADARIVLRNESNPSATVAETRTGTDGYFEFPKVASGEYWVFAFPPSGGQPIKRYLWARPSGSRVMMHAW